MTASLGPRRGGSHRPVAVPPNLDALRGALIGAVLLPCVSTPAALGPRRHVLRRRPVSTGSVQHLAWLARPTLQLGVAHAVGVNIGRWVEC